MSKSPLAPQVMPALPPISGARLGATACGIRYNGRTDLCLIVFDEPAAIAGVFTQSATAAAPILWCRECLPGGVARAIVVNSGNANAFTGRLGDEAVRATVDAAADALGCQPGEVFTASTGVIGEPLAADKIVAALPELVSSVNQDGWSDAAAAIMTTDTFAKYATRIASIGGATVTINGFAKGSGMIAPDMATMLAFLVTDAALPAAVLQEMLVAANDDSFNAITVDSDTSTSDAVLLCATGKADHPPITDFADPALDGFRTALEDIMRELAQMIVRDGEGASKFISVTVTGAESKASARQIGLAIANSPLVKTAIAGEDANWGRIVMAVGKSGARADRDALKIKIGGVTITENGARVPNYDETPVVEHMTGQEIDIDVDVGVGDARATVWTCDLTHGYITINADYRS